MRELPIDCCATRDLNPRRTLHDSSHATEIVMQCVCGAWWFYRFHEWNDDITTWYTRLTDREAELVLTAATPDLELLTTKPSFMVDGSGVHRVAGQPASTYGGT